MGRQERGGQHDQGHKQGGTDEDAGMHDAQTEKHALHRATDAPRPERTEGDAHRRAKRRLTGGDSTNRTVTGTGQHTFRVRAFDAHGIVQDAHHMDPFPSGSTGFHQILVTGRAP